VTRRGTGRGAGALFLGDSYTSGWALADADVPLRWTTLVADALGWEEINAGFPGAGYVASGPVSRAPYRQILPRFAGASPRIVVVSGGLNDLYADDARIAKAVRSTMRALADGFPDSMRIAVSAVSPVAGAGDGSVSGRLAALNSVLREASAESGALVLDIGEPLLASSVLVGPDGIHPTVAGHAALAASFDAALGASGLLEA
jgi:lysophospholipase L1-like esterase